MTQHNPSADKNVLDVRKRRSASSSAVRDFRARLSSVGTGLFAYELDLMQSFARNHLHAWYLMSVFTLGVALLAMQWHSWLTAGLWAGFAIVAYLLLGGLARQFLRQERKQEELPVWRFRFAASQTLIAAVWISFAFAPCPTGPDLQHAIIQFSAILIFQAATFMFSYTMRYGALLMVLPATLVFATRYFLTLEPAMVFMGATALVSAVFFVTIAHRFKTSLLLMLENRTIQEMLIAELETEKSISETARSQAEDANLAKSRFLATMSHELRTPLNAILGFSEIMREELMGPIGNDQYRDYVADIHNSGTHLLKLINEILDISRIEAGRQELNEVETRLVSIADDARHMMKVKADQKGVTLTTAFEENMPKVWVDERSIRQVILNLLSNALKFTPTGGTITIKVGWTSKGSQYIAVKDTGPGIPEDEIPIVLSSFGQGAIAIQHAEQGTGLGLTIVQALLHMHQGRFELKSGLRQGTEAIAFIPRDRVLFKKSEKTAAMPEAGHAKVA